MSIDNSNEKNIKVTAVLMKVYGWFTLLGLPLLAYLIPAGFLWGSHSESPNDPFSPYFFMLGSVYFALAVVLIRSANNPERHTSIIDFTIYSSIAHALVMTVQSFWEEHELMHLMFDIPLLLIMAFTLWYWHPTRKVTA